jgi:hypothetical protein
VLSLASLALGLVQAPTGTDEAARTLALLKRPAHDLAAASAGTDESSRKLLPLLRAYVELLGWKLALDPALEAQLAQADSDLRLTADVAREDVHALVESVARLHGLFFRFDAHPGEVRLRVERLESDEGRKAFAAPIAIPLELLPAWSGHPAYLLALEIPHAPEGSAALATRLQTLLPQGALRAEISAQPSGALRVSGSAAVLEFVAGTLSDGPKLAAGLETATFPADPNTPQGITPAILPQNLRAAFPQGEGEFVLLWDVAPPSQLEILQSFGHWARRPLLFQGDEVSESLAAAKESVDAPQSVPAAWAHEFVSGILADAGCALAPLPARHPVCWVVGKHPREGALALDPVCVPVVRLGELATVAHLPATRFQTFALVPKLGLDALAGFESLRSPDAKEPFWITQLDDPRVLSIIGTPRAITSAVLALRLLLSTPKDKR